MQHPIVVSVLLGLAVLLSFLSCIGVAVMRDAFQRLHFPAVVVTFATLLIIVAVWIDQSDPQARIKVILVGVVLFLMNAVLTNATAKAVRIRQTGHWEPHPQEKIQVMGREEVAGTYGATEDHEA